MAGTYNINRYGYRYSINVDDEVMEQSYRRGELVEQGMLDWIVNNVPKGGIWIDCGANVGEHSLVFATACEADTVYAFEPNLANFRKLEFNTEWVSSEKLIALRMGVGSEPQLMGIVNTAQGRPSQTGLDRFAATCNVPVIALDAIVPEDRLIRLIKIDVEGMEQQVISGALRILDQRHPELFIEIWKQADLDDITKQLATFGYTLIECYGEAPTFHFSASGRYAVTYKPRQLQ